MRQALIVKVMVVNYNKSLNIDRFIRRHMSITVCICLLRSVLFSVAILGVVLGFLLPVSGLTAS